VVDHEAGASVAAARSHCCVCSAAPKFITRAGPDASTGRCAPLSLGRVREPAAVRPAAWVDAPRSRRSQGIKELAQRLLDAPGSGPF